MSEQIFKKRSVLASPKSEKSKEQIQQIPPAETKNAVQAVQDKDNLIFELETSLTNLRQAVNQTENLLNKVTAAIEKE